MRDTIKPQTDKCTTATPTAAKREPAMPSWQSFFMLGFGLFILAFLTAIERPHWFHLRPVSGTAMAMAAAAK